MTLSKTDLVDGRGRRFHKSVKLKLKQKHSICESITFGKTRKRMLKKNGIFGKQKSKQIKTSPRQLVQIG